MAVVWVVVCRVWAVWVATITSTHKDLSVDCR